MARLQNILDDFNEAIADVAVAWQEQRGNFTDNKIEQFGTNILRPISNAGAKLNLQAEQLGSTLKKISGSGTDRPLLGGMKFAANWNEHFIYKGFLCARTVDPFCGSNGVSGTGLQYSSCRVEKLIR